MSVVAAQPDSSAIDHEEDDHIYARDCRRVKKIAIATTTTPTIATTTTTPASPSSSSVTSASVIAAGMAMAMMNYSETSNDTSSVTAGAAFVIRAGRLLLATPLPQPIEIDLSSATRISGPPRASFASPGATTQLTATLVAAVAGPRKLQTSTDGGEVKTITEETTTAESSPSSICNADDTTRQKEDEAEDPRCIMTVTAVHRLKTHGGHHGNGTGGNGSATTHMLLVELQSLITNKLYRALVAHDAFVTIVFQQSFSYRVTHIDVRTRTVTVRPISITQPTTTTTTTAAAAIARKQTGNINNTGGDSSDEKQNSSSSVRSSSKPVTQRMLQLTCNPMCIAFMQLEQNRLNVRASIINDLTMNGIHVTSLQSIIMDYWHHDALVMISSNSSSSSSNSPSPSSSPSAASSPSIITMVPAITLPSNGSHRWLVTVRHFPRPRRSHDATAADEEYVTTLLRYE